MSILHDNEKNLYEDLRLPEGTIQEIIEIYEAFSDDQKKILTFYILVDDNVTMMARYFCYDELFVMETLQQSLAAFPPVHLLEIRQVLRIYLQSRDDLPMIFPEDDKNENFFVYRWKQFRGFVHRLGPIERVVIGICAIAFFYASATTGTALYRLGMVRIDREKSATMYMNPDEETPQRETIESLFLPAYLPDGYIMTEQIGETYLDPFVETFYSDGIYELRLQQNTTDTTLDLNNEKGITKNITIQGNAGVYREKEDLNILVWSEKDYFYSIHSSNPDLKEKDLLKIAKSLKEISQ